ncbi:hypothetical protein BG004_000982 [Podila humilis]|nr:hypothetical protein BG004_000982 [Podila humilis]
MISQDIDEKAKPYASLIIVVKFFFYRFMNKCIGYPETYGMLQDTFIPDRQRQRILFTTHHRLYRYVTSLMSPVPGWESRSPILDPRLKEKIEAFTDHFSLNMDREQTARSVPKSTLQPIADSSIPSPPRLNSSAHAAIAATKGTAVTPFLLLCPSDFTTLFYFVCPNLRRADKSPFDSLVSSSVHMTRSSSFSGEGSATTRQRTSSGTPSTHPQAMKAAAKATNNASNISGSSLKGLPNVSCTRTHKRASPSFSFFAGASVTSRASPPPLVAIEKAPSATGATEASANGVPFIAFSGTKSCLTTSPQMAPVHVTSVVGNLGPTLASTSNPASFLERRSQSASAPLTIEDPPVIKHWSDETLLPSLLSALSEIKNIQQEPIKETSHVPGSHILSPQKEAWALVYVQYCDSGSAPGPEGTHSSVFQGHQEQLEVGLVMAPSCMAMVMENIEHGGSKIVTVTKPMLVDQMMDFAGRRSELGSRSVDLKVDESTTDSTMASEDNSLRYETDILSPQDKEISILRVNSSQESSLDASGTKNIPLRETDEDHPRSTQHKAPLNSNSAYYITSNRPNSPALLLKKTTADRAWKARIRDTVHSEHDFPEDIRSVARSVFKILRGFDMVATAVCEQETLNDGCGEVRSLLLQGMEQARLFGNHSSAIGFHHSLHVLETSNVFRQLDSSKLIYLLAMPLERRLEHRAGRARVRTLWESYAHSWHARVVPSIDRKRESLSSLRIKMYYQTCVRPSRAFEKSLGVVSVLSRLNKAALRKQFAVDEWDGPPGYSDSLSEKSTVFLTMLDSKTEKSGSRHLCGLNVCYGVCFENPCPAARIPGETSFGQTVDAPSRMPSNNKSSHSHANRMGKVRRSSFSSYIDNMTSRSFGAHSLKESGLSNLKEKEQASFSMSNSSNHLGGTFWSQSNESQTRSKGLQSVAEGISNDFVMDAREAEAVQRWVDDSGIHNFLPGEDNFLRFCMEIESVVRGIGLGGTGIQGAGISQAQNGIVTPGLASSGSDFFVKEVAKFNSQFVPGMGPTEQTVTQTRVSGASGVAEFLANSFKSSQAGTSAPTTSGTHFISHIVSQGNSDKHSLGGHVASSQSSTYSSSSGSRSRSRLQQRQAQLRTQLNIQDTIPNLLDDPRSVYASQAGPTYVLYNPPYGTTTHSASSSYSAYPPDNMSSTVAPHHPSHQPKDMPEFLRRIQLQLTSYLMSEWLDIFGEVETDRWLMEFLDELSGGTVSPNGVSNCDHDHDILSANGMRLGDKAIRRHISKTSKGISSPTYSTPNVPTASASSSLEGLGAEFSSESHPIESIASARSFVSSNKSLCSFPSFNSQDSVLGGHGTQLPVISSENMTMAERSNLSIQEADIHEKSRSSAVADLSMTVPYNLQDAYKSTIEKFDHTKSPSRKLGYLFALELLIVASLSYPDSCSVPAHGRPSNSSPRTKRDQQNPSLLGGSNMSPKAITPGTDAIVDEIESVFRMLGGLRPKHLLRDMQLIATFIPGSILDLRDDGKAFWDMALAVTSLKTDVVEYVVKKATRYVEMDDDNSDSKLDTDRSGSRAIMQDDEERVRMSEAVRLFTIGAKESHPVAQRELAILYMSLPMLPSSSSPKIGYHREDISDHKPTGHAPSPVLFTPSRLGPAGTKTTPPASPQGTFSSTMLGSSFMSGGTTASIPIKQKSSRHQHSSSGGTGSSFGSGVLNGLGIMAGLGSFTGSSSTGSASEDPPTKAATSTTTYPSPSIKRNNRSTTSLNQHHAAAFAEGHDIEQYQEMHLVETYDNITSMNQKGASSSHSRHQRPQQQHHKHHHQQRHLHQTQAGDPDKFNPENVAAAMHWFSLAAAQGDQFSINYLKHKETLRGLSP